MSIKITVAISNSVGIIVERCELDATLPNNATREQIEGAIVGCAKSYLTLMEEANSRAEEKQCTV